MVTSARAASKASTVPCSPLDAAAISAVRPWLSLRFGSTCAASSERTASVYPPSDAIINAFTPPVALRARRRGWNNRCPHCGVGALFSGWAHHLDRCSSCGLVYERNRGDTWAFTIIGDRLPLGALVILLYFGVIRSHRALGIAI